MFDEDGNRELTEEQELEIRERIAKREAHELLCARIRAARAKGEFIQLYPPVPSTEGMP